MAATLASLFAGLALAACGSQGSSADESMAMTACISTGATRTQCECAVTKAEAAGIGAKRMADEENNGTAIGDSKFIKIAASCVIP